MRRGAAPAWWTTLALAPAWTLAAAAAAGGVPARPQTANAAPCEACHGAHGEGMPAASVPRLAGQSADYLEKELRDYASGARQNPIMQGFAKGLSDSERAALAAYYASQTAPYVSAPVAAAPAPVGAAPDPRQLARGHQLAHQGAEAERVQACDNCHGPDGAGEPHAAPYLAGQSAEYLAASLKSWQQGTRKNDAGQLMASVVARLSDSDIAAVSAYFASVKGNAK